MKKRIAFRKLGRTPAHKWSMMRNMVSSLIEHERIVTTVAKAKEIRHLADQMITLAKKGGSLQQQFEADNGGVSVEPLSSTETGPIPPQAKASPEYLHNRRRAAAIVRGDDNVTKLFEVLGPRYADRQGGYTRVMKIARNRHGDNAPMAVIEYIDRPGEIRAARPPSRTLSEMLQEMGISPVDELGIPPEEVKTPGSSSAGTTRTKTTTTTTTTTTTKF